MILVGGTTKIPYVRDQVARFFSKAPRTDTGPVAPLILDVTPRSLGIGTIAGFCEELDSNVVIGDLRLEELPRRPRGETSIEVTFSLDASGILRVRARDAATGHEQRATLDLVGGMRKEEVAASRERLQHLRR